MGVKANIFSETNERLNLALPMVLLALLVFGFSGQNVFRTVFGDSSHLAQRLLADIVFLNVTHNAFTIMMIASFPELRPWVIEQGSGDGRRFLIKTILIFAGLSAFFLAALLSQSVWIFGIFGLVTTFFPIQHALAQSLGLSLVYNGKTQDAPDRKRKVEWIERRLVMVLIFLIAVSVVAVRSTFFSFEIARGDFGLSTESLLFRFTLVLGLLLVGLMLFYPKPIRKKKTVFALRFPIWAYSLISPFGLMATQLIHGMEYFFVLRKMAATSKFERWKSASLLLLFFVTVFGVFRVVYYDGSIVGRDQAPIWLAVIAALSTAFSFLHYYLDRELFLMRKPTNRQTVGALLK